MFEHPAPDAVAGRRPEAKGTTEDAVSFTLLGPLEIRKGSQDFAPTAPKILQLLALLVMRAGRVVHIDSIIQELWAGDPPRSVRTTLQTYIYHLRKCIANNGLGPDPNKILTTKAPGYVFWIEPEQVDVFLFEKRCQEGKDLFARAEFAAASRAYRGALNLWSGQPFANVQCGPVLLAAAVELQEQQRNALHQRIQADMADGLHRELIGELRSLVTTNPLDEELHGLLMRALSVSGRRSDALATYRSLRAVLNEELGVEPCDELQLLHRDLLTAGEAFA